MPSLREPSARGDPSRRIKSSSSTGSDFLRLNLSKSTIRPPIAIAPPTPTQTPMMILFLCAVSSSPLFDSLSSVWLSLVSEGSGVCDGVSTAVLVCVTIMTSPSEACEVMRVVWILVVGVGGGLVVVGSVVEAVVSGSSSVDSDDDEEEVGVGAVVGVGVGVLDSEVVGVVSSDSVLEVDVSSSSSSGDGVEAGGAVVVSWVVSGGEEEGSTVVTTVSSASSVFVLLESCRGSRSTTL